MHNNNIIFYRTHNNSI